MTRWPAGHWRAWDSQQVRDVFLEALAETSETDDGGLFAHIGYQLTGAIDITETDEGLVRIDATALVEGRRIVPQDDAD